MPNRVPEPTPALVMPPADAGATPRLGADHQDVPAKAMNPILWLLLRVAFIAWFGEACSGMVVESPVFPSDPTIVIFFPFAFVFFAWRCFSILLRRYKKRKANDDWSASLWCSPCLQLCKSHAETGCGSMQRPAKFTLGGYFQDGDGPG
jgi:hypothetical protein